MEFQRSTAWISLSWLARWRAAAPGLLSPPAMGGQSSAWEVPSLVFFIQYKYLVCLLCARCLETVGSETFMIHREGEEKVIHGHTGTRTGVTKSWTKHGGLQEHSRQLEPAGWGGWTESSPVAALTLMRCTVLTCVHVDLNCLMPSVC